MKDPNNLIPERGKKLHEIYMEKFGNKDLTIKRGMELQSQKYQLKLARLVLCQFEQEIFSKFKRKITIYIKGCCITHYGNCTKEELIAKYSKEKKKDKL